MTKSGQEGSRSLSQSVTVITCPRRSGLKRMTAMSATATMPITTAWT